MKLSKLFTLIFGLLILAGSSFAATSGTGCYIPSKGKIYKTVKSGNEYKTSPTISITGVICILNGAGTTCRVKFSGSYTYGVAGNWNKTYCPIDDNVVFLLFGTLMIGFVLIRKKQLLFLQTKE
ncbi:MAG: hypothetical protein V4541_07295 [Bacteroidota bacterium]